MLLDNTVLAHAITHVTAWISTSPKSWGGQPIKTGYLARIPVHPIDSRSKEYQHIVYLAGIAHLSRIGAIELCTSAELGADRFRHPPGRFQGIGYYDYSIFDGIDIKSLDGFVFDTIVPVWLGSNDPTSSQRARLHDRQSDPFYASLLKHLGPKNSQDAWHIYTAEKHGAYCFLTMDFSLIENVRAQAGSKPLQSLRTRILTPQEFGTLFKLRPVAPYLLSYNRASFPVRPDLTMPGGKRRRSKPPEGNAK